MSAASDHRSREFLAMSSQFSLGSLVTEASHPVTAHLSEVAQRDVAQALDLLFQVDQEVVSRFSDFVASNRAGEIKDSVVQALKSGGRILFTGCGSTGRLSIQLTAIWRDFWRRHASDSVAGEWEHRAFSVMAGGDFALIKSVEGFEDFAGFGKKQLSDLGVSSRDVVFAITEGGETSFVIGTAWKGVEAGAKVYFVYNNPDEILCARVERSRTVIEDPRFEKINLTTGPMAITGSTRMQATSIQLCVLLTVLEMTVLELLGEPDETVPARFLAALKELVAGLRSAEVRERLAQLVLLETSLYRSGRKNQYFAARLGLDVLTDTTERSPTYCIPPFRKFDDSSAAESWSFLFLPDADTPAAWERILQRPPQCIEWTPAEVRDLVGAEQERRFVELTARIRSAELMRFRIGLDGLNHRKINPGDGAIGILTTAESESLLSLSGFHRTQLERARKAGARLGLIAFGDAATLAGLHTEFLGIPAAGTDGAAPSVLVPVPAVRLRLDGVLRVGVKLILNALSTGTMVRLGRVMGNRMVWVVASNLKLIDRATRYIQGLTGTGYADANRLLFEVIEYVEPRMKADQAYPPVVGLAVTRHRFGLSNEDAERKWAQEQAGP